MSRSLGLQAVQATAATSRRRICEVLTSRFGNPGEVISISPHECAHAPRLAEIRRRRTAHHCQAASAILIVTLRVVAVRQLHSIQCYSLSVSGRGEVLHKVMLETSTTQSELSRISGVRQPSISQFLSGKVELSDEQLDRLLSCMGYQLEVVRRPVTPKLTRSERRSWELHRQLSSQLNRYTLEEWRPTIERNLERLRGRVTGQPHLRNLEHWTSLVQQGDVLKLHRVMTGLDRDSIEMREVSPMGGLLSSDLRAEVLTKIS